MVTASRSKTCRGSRDAAGPRHSPGANRTKELEKKVADLSGENRELRINQIVDLRVASDLVPECERAKWHAATAKLGDEALKLIRQDLLMFFSRLNAAAKSSTGMEPLSYVM